MGKYTYAQRETTRILFKDLHTTDLHNQWIMGLLRRSLWSQNNSPKVVTVMNMDWPVSKLIEKFFLFELLHWMWNYYTV